MHIVLLSSLIAAAAISMATAASGTQGAAALPLSHHHYLVEIRQTPHASSSSVNVTVPSTVEDGIQTECKTCPYKLCTNVAAYEYGHTTNLTCWTEGDKIVDTTTWFKTTDDCYVTEWDLVEGNYTEVLSYCGSVEQTYTTGPSKTVYNTECNIIPEFVESEEDHTKMYQPEVDLTLTCFTNEGEAVLGNTVWYKTLSNCYVPEAEIEFVDATLDDCGPIPFMEAKMREPDPEASGVAQPVPLVASSSAFGGASTSTSPSTTTTSTTAPGPLLARKDTDRAGSSKRWLYITQIGDDFADCLSHPDSSSSKVKQYPFGGYVIVQCAGYSENEADNDQIYLYTEDFCWINDTLTDPQLIDDEERSEFYPNCNLFVDTEV
ncbi:hypothetical protein BD289DRAFT_264266 [Coniella lustricola]|uniref:Ig-like domain-containing protein n=1 Tax=Coniella lustricola TaxID=2025994 RepID=A0A2T3A7B7_9PEZI|nr:hypothetical protein BD289DRAFT_264266 [Coniella lustricola]